MDTANVGGIIGSVIGILGGVVGTYFSIKNTNGPRERRFMIRAALVAWFVLGLTAVAMLLSPEWRAWAWAPLCALVVVGVPLGNRRQQMIRQAEAGSVSELRR